MADGPLPLIFSLAGPLLAALSGGYLLGSIPFGLVLSKAFGYDVRSMGSGNIGATNVLRTGRKDLALATLILDSGKGAVVAWALSDGITVSFLDTSTLGLAAGLGAVLGHNFPLWLRFKGGKGVATTLGVLLVTAWPVGVTSCLVWLLVAALFGYSSLAALVSLSVAPLIAFAITTLGEGFHGLVTPVHTGVYLVLALLSIVRHRENIRRLCRGEESKIGKKNA